MITTESVPPNLCLIHAGGARVWQRRVEAKSKNFFLDYMKGGKNSLFPQSNISAKKPTTCGDPLRDIESYPGSLIQTPSHAIFREGFGVLEKPWLLKQSVFGVQIGSLYLSVSPHIGSLLGASGERKKERERELLPSTLKHFSPWSYPLCSCVSV